MIRSLLAVAVVAIGVGTLAAQTDPVATRKALMKANGDQARIATGDCPGETAVRSRRCTQGVRHFHGGRRKSARSVSR